jgi:septum formation protein
MALPLILASASPIRAELLHRAGLDFRVEVSRVDEDEIKASMQADGGSAEDCVIMLAEMKAARISTRFPGTLVIGADQMLTEGDTWYDKPRDRAEALDHLGRLQGKTHRLVTAAVVAFNGSRIWHTLDQANLTMHRQSPAELDAYLVRAGDAVLSSVGVYQLEGLGVSLFRRIEGDYFTILGLPLLPLLTYLRGHQAAAEEEPA